jgi:nucleotide-binding universal stress UspA family protein
LKGRQHESAYIVIDIKELIPVSIVLGPPIVVGLDGTEASAAALAWAAAEAAAHRAQLVVVHVLDPRGRAAVYSHTDADASDEQDHVLAHIKELIDQADVGPVEQVFEIGVPGRVLVRLAREARMLVLGQAGRHHRAGHEDYDNVYAPALGPIARACVAGAECPVVVVPEPVLGKTAAHAEEPEHHAPVRGARAIYPFQGRIPVVHH